MADRAGAVAPSAAAPAAVRPLPADAVLLGPGFWHERTAANAERSLRAGLAQLEAAGTLENFRLAAGSASGEYRGAMVFLDSDVYKWLEAVCWHLQREPSAAWSARADEVIEAIAAAQEPDGYLNTYTQVVRKGERWADLAMGHEMYCAGHLIQAGVAHHRATGRVTLFGVARRFADLLVAQFGEGGRRTGYCGHPEIETALVELFRETGTRGYLDLARRMVDLRGSGLLGDRPYGRRYFQDAQPVRKTRSVHGHAVRALYLAAGVTDVYLETDERDLLDILRAQWADLLGGKAYITGGVGSRYWDEAFGDAFELPPDQAYTETCAAIALMQWSWRMLLATGESQYADMFERVLYNGFLAGVALDGESYFYVNPLQVRPDSTIGPTGRRAWFTCACCPPNVMRTLASLTHYLATTDARGLQIQQYADCAVRARAAGAIGGGAAVGCDISTDYPRSGRVQIRIPEDCAGEWMLSLRIPAWARGRARLRVDGDPVLIAECDYVRLARSWRGGEIVELDLPMAPRLTVADPRVDAVRGCVAIERGPVVYCAEQVDQPDALALDDVRVLGWERDGPRITMGGVELPTVRVDAVAAAPPAEQGGRPAWPYRPLTLRPHAVEHRESQYVTLTAIPYFAWANRGPGAMRVWLPLDPELGSVSRGPR